MTRNKLFIFDPKTGQFSPAPEAMAQAPSGFVWNHYFVSRRPYDDKSPIALDKMPLAKKR